MLAFLRILLWCFCLTLLIKAHSATYEELLKQESRPSVSQVSQLLEYWHPPALSSQTTGLHVDKLVKDSLDLHYNFPKWFQVLMENAPKMIATFERSFPGATWVFIGRDMAIFADLFEAFYTSIGQNNRVARLKMSSGTLEGLTDELAYKFLKSNLFDETSEFPYVFVDAVSRGGGRQGRALINSIYAMAGPEAQAKLAWLIAFIGLKVSTSSIDDNPVENAHNFLRTNKPNRDTVFTYCDGRDYKANAYFGMNEAGYSHWTGAWHGPHGRLKTDEEPISASILPMVLLGATDDAAIQRVRASVLTFQAHVISYARLKEFQDKVLSEADKLDYIFPLDRPAHTFHTLEKLGKALKSATTVQEFFQAIEAFKGYDLHRTSSNMLDRAIKTDIAHFFKLNPTPDELLAFDSLVGISRVALIKNYIQTATLDQVLELLEKWKTSGEDLSSLIDPILDNFFNKNPNLVQINSLIDFIPANSQIHQKVFLMALPKMSSRADYKSVKRANLSFYQKNDYTKAVKKFKKKYPKPRFDFLKWLKENL